MTILLVDDEREIADLAALYLENEGFNTRKFYCGRDALECVAREKIDLAILDVMLPDIDGFELCRRIRRSTCFPSSCSRPRTRNWTRLPDSRSVRTIMSPSPFRPLELVARVKAQLRRFTRYNPSREAEEDVLSIKGLTLNRLTHECTLDEKPLSLTPTEFSILWLLMEKPGQVIGAEELFERVWGEKYLNNAGNTVMVHIRHLRKSSGILRKSPGISRPCGEWDIKLKAEMRRIWIRALIWWVLIFFGVPVLTLIAYGMAGSLIRNILNSFFFYTGGAVNWGGIGTIWMIAGIGVPALTVLFCAVSSSRAVRKAQNKNIWAIETFLRGLDAEQTPDSLPPEWFFLERSLISSKREAQLAGEQAKLEAQRKNDLVTYLAHDLRTPLASVLGYVSLLDEAPDLPPGAEKEIYENRFGKGPPPGGLDRRTVRRHPLQLADDGAAQGENSPPLHAGTDGG